MISSSHDLVPFYFALHLHSSFYLSFLLLVGLVCASACVVFNLSPPCTRPSDVRFWFISQTDPFQHKVKCRARSTKLEPTWHLDFTTHRTQTQAYTRANAAHPSEQPPRQPISTPCDLFVTSCLLNGDYQSLWTQSPVRHSCARKHRQIIRQLGTRTRPHPPASSESLSMPVTEVEACSDLRPARHAAVHRSSPHQEALTAKPRQPRWRAVLQRGRARTSR